MRKWSMVESLGYRQARVGMDCRHEACREYVRGWNLGRLEWRSEILNKKVDGGATKR
jgi:hypothetical protein